MMEVGASLCGDGAVGGTNLFELLLLVEPQGLGRVRDLTLVVVANVESGLAHLHRTLQVGPPHHVHIPATMAATEIGRERERSGERLGGRGSVRENIRVQTCKKFHNTIKLQVPAVTSRHAII